MAERGMIKTHFEAVAHRKDGSFALVSSSLTGRQWDGNLWVFKSLQHFRECPNLFLSNTRMSAGASDALWLPNERDLLVASDSGSLDIWACNDPLGGSLELRGSLRAHDDMALCVCRLGGGAGEGGGAKVASGGADGRVVVSDVESMKQLKSYRGHMDIVLSIAASTSQENVFVTSSKDGAVCLWDLRLRMPARNMTACSSGVYTSSAWGANTLALGSERGVVEVLDVRGEAYFLFASCPLHKSSIHRMTFAPWDSSLLATAADDRKVHVHCITTNTTVYNDDGGHVDFVRGASWDPDPEGRGLITCGWDGRVLRHNVPHLPPQANEGGVAVTEESSAPSHPSVAMETEPLKKVPVKNGFIVPDSVEM